MLHFFFVWFPMVARTRYNSNVFSWTRMNEYVLPILSELIYIYICIHIYIYILAGTVVRQQLFVGRWIVICFRCIISFTPQLETATQQLPFYRTNHKGNFYEHVGECIETTIDFHYSVITQLLIWSKIIITIRGGVIMVWLLNYMRAGI